MLRLRPFFVTLALLIAAIQAIQQFVLSPADPFSPGEKARLERLDGLSIAHMAAYKIRHVLEQPRYDVIVFGNSNALGVQSGYLEKFGRVFNLAVPGSSLRFTVGIAELLERAGRLPKTLVISVENFDVHTQQVQHMPLRWRWRNSIDDILAGLGSPGVTAKEVAHMSVRLLREEFDQFLASFNPRLLVRHAGFMLPRGAKGPTPGLLWEGFRRDGSGNDMARRTPGRVKLQKRPLRTSVLEGYLKLDLERLSRLNGKPRVILYESPLEPNHMAQYAANPIPRARRLRRIFMANDTPPGLERHLAPMLGLPGQPNRWIDHYHPPVDRIAPWLAGLLRGAGATGGLKP